MLTVYHWWYQICIHTRFA